MAFTHDTRVALGAAVALANSALDEPDSLATVQDLDDFCTEWIYSGARAHSAAELEAVRALRPRLRELLSSEREQAVETVNTLLREHAALPQLVKHDGWDWHLHAIDYAQPLVERVAVETAMAMVDVIRADEMDRFGICADESCHGIVLDLSRNRSKIFCSTTCGNRAAVAAYRARQAEA